jgi:putative transposase
LLGLARSSYYYQPQLVSALDLACMRRMDETFTRHPFGSRRLRDDLADQGLFIGRDHVRRLMRQMGIEAIYPKKRLSIANKKHKVYPYLLRGLSIVRPDQVWCSDITYLRLQHGFAYLVAVMDWFSRYVISWELSLSLDCHFCNEALQAALRGDRPAIFNTDQGSQFTAHDFTQPLIEAQVKISMDGKGRAFDNIMIERLWRTVKYEEVYLKDYEHFFIARDHLEDYFHFYNHQRRHSTLHGKTPAQVYYQDRQGGEKLRQIGQGNLRAIHLKSPRKLS